MTADSDLPSNRRHPIDTDHLAADLDALRQLAQHLAHDEHRADDVVQETLMTAMRGASQPVADTSAWLRGVVRRVVANHRRRETIHRTRERAAISTGLRLETADRDPASRFDDGERASQIARAVSELDDPYREVVELAYYEDLDSPAIARRTGVESATVRTRLHRARAILRRRLASQYGPAAVGLAPLVPTSDGGATAVAVGSAGSWASPVALKIAASVAISVALTVGIVANRVAARGDATRPDGDAALVASLPVTPVDDVIERAARFPAPAQETMPAARDTDAVSASLASTRQPYRTDRRARLQRFEAEIRAPFMAYHDLPLSLRSKVSRYGVFLQRANGSIAVLEFKDIHDRDLQIDAEERATAEHLLLEYDDQATSIESYVALQIADGRLAGLQRESLPVGSSATTVGRVETTADADLALVVFDQTQRAENARRQARLESLRTELGVPRVRLSVASDVDLSVGPPASH